MPNRIKFKPEASAEYYTAPINPIVFDSGDDRIFKQELTIDGQSIEQIPMFDARIRTMIWNKIPNKTPYNTMVTQLRQYINAGTINMQLRDLSGTEADTTVQDIRIIDVQTQFTLGPSSAESKLSYEYIKLLYVPLLVANE